MVPEVAAALLLQFWLAILPAEKGLGDPAVVHWIDALPPSRWQWQHARVYR